MKTSVVLGMITLISFILYCLICIIMIKYDIFKFYKLEKEMKDIIHSDMNVKDKNELLRKKHFQQTLIKITLDNLGVKY